MDKLKPCPFCGGRAEINYAEFNCNFLGFLAKYAAHMFMIILPRRQPLKNGTEELTNRKELNQNEQKDSRQDYC